MIVLLLLLLIACIAAGFFCLVKYKNKRPTPDYFEIYKAQDTVPEGKLGVFVTGLIMPTNLNVAFFYNITRKIFSNIVPWPFKILAMLDRGVALLDPVRYHEHHEFTPTKLEDPAGRDCDLDGEPYIDKYRRGEVRWMPPSTRLYLDHGYFLYAGRKGGMATLCGKVLNKARIWYYDKGIKQKKLPHWEETFKVIHSAFARLKDTYGNIECRAESGLLYQGMKQKIFELLDAGCQTIIVASPMGIYSHFEEFDSAFRHCFEYVHEWQASHPGKKIKIIMAPPMGQFKPLRDAFVQMLKDRLDTLPRGCDVTVAVTVHGMPFDSCSWEAWLQLAPPYRDRLVEDVQELLKSYKFGRTNVVLCQDEFADPVWDPKKKYLSTNQAYWNAVSDGYDYAIGLPIEFFAENSDTLFHHALKNYHGFDTYDVYEQIDYPDSSVPYVRMMKQEKTTIIYNGVPVGKYQPYVADALYQAIASILSKKNT